MRLFAWWIFGLAISIGLGALLTPWLLLMIRRYVVARAKDRGEIIDDVYLISDRLALLVGSIERLFFTVLVAFDISGTATAMMGWVTVKMLTDWLRILKPEAELGVKSLAFAALLGNVISLFFALVGGLICRHGNG